MADERVAMCKTVNYFGGFLGEFLPCIGASLAVNYVFRGARVSLSREGFERLHDAVVIRREAWLKWREHDIELSRHHLLVDADFILQNAHADDDIAETSLSMPDESEG